MSDNEFVPLGPAMVAAIAMVERLALHVRDHQSIGQPNSRTPNGNPYFTVKLKVPDLPDSDELLAAAWLRYALPCFFDSPMAGEGMPAVWLTKHNSPVVLVWRKRPELMKMDEEGGYLYLVSRQFIGVER